jgi:hypothetical protein
MFDMLTLDQLCKLHHSLAETHHALHGRLVDQDDPGRKPLVPVLSDDWNIISAACQEVSETMTAVYAEIGAREAELVASRG